MSRYVVFEPGDAAVGVPSDRARFVRDGFAGWAILFPFLWLFRHGLFLWGFGAMVLWFGFGLLSDIPGLRLAGAVLPILLGLLVALEGPSLRSAKLARMTYREAAVVEAQTEEEAAILYYTGSESTDVSRESSVDSRETPIQSGRPRPFGAARSLLDPPRTMS